MKVKSIFVILVTLIIGFILGMLTSAQIRYHRLKPVRVFFSEERFRDGFYKTLQPEEQQARLKDMDDRRQAMIRQNRKNHPNDSLNFRDDRWHNPGRRFRPDGTPPPPPPPFRENDTARLPY